MEKIFIPYEQSLQLKELGFNELCIRGWYEDESLYYHPDSDIILDNPTFSQAFKFFRDKYEKYGTIRYGYNEFNKSVYLFPCINGIITGNDSFESYEEAELECLNKLIESVKTN